MKFVMAILLMGFSFLFAKPMESIERYNIILVHGAADSLQGIDCSSNYPKAAYSYWDTIAGADTLR